MKEQFSISILKNPTPHQIALLAAISIALVITLLSLFWGMKSWSGIGNLFYFSAFVIPFILSYTVVHLLLKQYIHRKIKLIYKSIHAHKLSLNEKKGSIKMNTPVMEEVEKEVSEWAQNQAAEIKQLKTWQEYRRKFLGDISHELKTPIFNIQGYLETLIEGGVNDESVNMIYLQRASRNVERLNTIVEDLEVISRLESGELILDIQPFDIKVLTEEVFQDMEFKASDKKMKLVFKPGADQNYHVNADREYIRQVLTNLIHNSIKYGNESGIVKVSFYDLDKYLLIEIADNGIGISPKDIKYIFDRFYRVDKSRTREQGGSGLGLSIVKHIIEAHRQTINVRSTPQVGSTFGFTLEKSRP